MTVRGVLFDIGGVIVTDGPDLDEVARALGLSIGPGMLERVGGAVWGRRDPYDLDLSDAEYWRAVASAAGAEPPTDAVIEQLTARDVARWSRPRVEVVGLVADLYGAGLTLGVLSNAPRSFAAGFRSQPWARVFDVAVFSCDTGVAKPAPGAYRRAVEEFARHGVAAHEIVFLDDRPANVGPARAAGLVAHRWVGTDDARDFLIGVGVPLGG